MALCGDAGHRYTKPDAAQQAKWTAFGHPNRPIRVVKAVRRCTASPARLFLAGWTGSGDLSDSVFAQRALEDHGMCERSQYG